MAEATRGGDSQIVDGVCEIVNDDTYGWTDEQHEEEIERLKRLVETTYRGKWDYIVETYGPTWKEE